MKNTLDLIGLVDVIGYWQLSDVDSEYIDTSRILFGGTGVISKDGLKKPGFSALKRLSHINTLMIGKEGNMLVTTVKASPVIMCTLYFGMRRPRTLGSPLTDCKLGDIR